MTRLSLMLLTIALTVAACGQDSPSQASQPTRTSTSIPTATDPTYTPTANATATRKSIEDTETEVAEDEAELFAAITVVPYELKLKNAGDGWNEGTVRLAFLNHTDMVIVSDGIEVEAVTVQTKEGVDYEADIAIESSWGWERASRVLLTPSSLPLLPGFHAIAATGSEFSHRVVEVRFRIASAATPSAIVISNWPEPIPLDAGPALDQLNKEGFSASGSFADLATTVQSDNESVDVEFTGECRLNRTGMVGQIHFGEFEYEVVNTDKFREQAVNIPLVHVYSYFADGRIVDSELLSGRDEGDFSIAYGEMLATLTLGPGQARTIYVPMFYYDGTNLPLGLVVVPNGLDAKSGDPVPTIYSPDCAS